LKPIRATCRATLQTLSVSKAHFKAAKHNWLIIAATGLFLLFEPAASAILQYDRVLIEANWQIWRLVTSHWVHLGLNHWLMNALGFGLITLIFQQEQSTYRDLCVFFTLSLAISLLIYVFSVDIGRYVGLSGVIHGYFVYYLAVGARQTPILCVVGWGCTLAKVVNEQLAHYDGSHTAELIGGLVAYDAHLYGFICGTLIGIIFLYSDRHQIFSKAKR